MFCFSGFLFSLSLQRHWPTPWQFCCGLQNQGAFSSLDGRFSYRSSEFYPGPHFCTLWASANACEVLDGHLLDRPAWDVTGFHSLFHRLRPTGGRHRQSEQGVFGVMKPASTSRRRGLPTEIEASPTRFSDAWTPSLLLSLPNTLGGIPHSTRHNPCFFPRGITQMQKPGGTQAELTFLCEPEPITWPCCAIFWSVKWNRKKNKKPKKNPVLMLCWWYLLLQLSRFSRVQLCETP